MEKFNSLKLRAWGLLGAGLGLLALAGCAEGKADTPSVVDIQQEGEYFEMPRPDGSTMPCLFYSDIGRDGHAGFSWLAVNCDWENAYTGPTSEVQTGTDVSQMDCKPAEDGAVVCTPTTR